MAKDLDTGYFDASPTALGGGFADLAAASHGSDLFAGFDPEEESCVRELEDREDMQDLIELSLHMND